ncbi:MAG: hypothetical protein C4325_03395 [Blastocatellia bacterium]
MRLLFRSSACQMAKLALFSMIFLNIVRAGDNWRPVSQAELQITASTVEPNADAEVLFWEVRVDDTDLQSLVMKHYIRVKIFTERGREKYSKVDIPYLTGVKIRNVIARVVKPDGSITELTKNDVFDREIARKDKLKVKAKSFAVAGIEPGVIFEYQYEENIPGGYAEDMRMIFQHDVPIRTISYLFKPFMSIRYLKFNMPDIKFEKDKGGYYRATLQNLTALKEEPYMPPEDEVRAWMLVYYIRDKDQDKVAMDFWSRLGGGLVKSYNVKDTLKPNKEVKAAAEQLTAGATTPDEKIRRIFDFCKQKVRNITYDTTLTEDQKEEIKPNKSAAETLNKMQGRVAEINELFGSLVASLGYETRLAFGGDRSEKFFTVEQAHESFIHFAAIAVKVGDTWKFYSPGDLFVPYGMLDWREESTGVLLLGIKNFITTQTPYSLPKQSVARRTATLTLGENGTLSGRVQMEFTGNLATERKKDNYRNSPNQREEDLRNEIKRRMSTAEVTNISIENVTDPEKPFIYQFDIRVPGYAQRTSRRLFIQPSFFKYGEPPVFQTETREYPVFFHYPWSEVDEITIKLPANFELESPGVPEPIADPTGISRLEYRSYYDSATNSLICKRNFEFGNNGLTVFMQKSYPPLKRLFDYFHSADNHTMTLRQR